MKVNDFLNSEKLQFPVEIWSPTEGEEKVVKRNNVINIIKSKSFPFLDMAFLWKKEELEFRVQLKKNRDSNI